MGSLGCGCQDIYLVYELMDTDLHQIVRSRQDLTEQHLQWFIYQARRWPRVHHRLDWPAGQLWVLPRGSRPGAALEGSALGDMRSGDLRSRSGQ